MHRGKLLTKDILSCLVIFETSKHFVKKKKNERKKKVEENKAKGIQNDCSLLKSEVYKKGSIEETIMSNLYRPKLHGLCLYIK